MVAQSRALKYLQVRQLATSMAGAGQITVAGHCQKSVITTLSATYPLKLLSPRVAEEQAAVVYVLSYGGGLVGGDQIELSVVVEPSAALVMLSQGSTKVFKSRPERRLAAPSLAITTQTTIFTVKGALFLLPDPVTCFQAASYNQVQKFHLSSSSSLVALDWLTSGRKSRGEEWSFTRYYSLNQVFVDGKCLIKDTMLLQQDDASRSIGVKMDPYSCYATLILLGPLVLGTIRQITKKYDQVTLMQAPRPPNLLWSLSNLDEGATTIIRVAGTETELVKNWLAVALSPLQDVIGVDVFSRTFR